MECNINLSAITKLVLIERSIKRLNYFIYSKCDETCLQTLGLSGNLIAAVEVCHRKLGLVGSDRETLRSYIKQMCRTVSEPSDLSRSDFRLYFVGAIGSDP